MRRGLQIFQTTNHTSVADFDTISNFSISNFADSILTSAWQKLTDSTPRREIHRLRRVGSMVSLSQILGVEWNLNFPLLQWPQIKEKKWLQFFLLFPASLYIYYIYTHHKQKYLSSVNIYNCLAGICCKKKMDNLHYHILAQSNQTKYHPTILEEEKAKKEGK